MKYGYIACGGGIRLGKGLDAGLVPLVLLLLLERAGEGLDPLRCHAPVPGRDGRSRRQDPVRNRLSGFRRSQNGGGPRGGSVSMNEPAGASLVRWRPLIRVG